MSTHDGVLRGLAAWVAEVEGRSLPGELREGAKAAIVDTTGVVLAGVDEPVTRIVASLLAEDGSRPLASQLGTRFRTSVEGAALVNGVSGHALDFDDVSGSVEGHPSVVILPAALAVAEMVGAGGEQLLAAYAVGFEVMAKLGLATGPEHYQVGWHATSTLGTLGAAAAAGKLLDLDADRLEAAIAIAVSMSSGSRENFGTMTKPFHAGHAARAGVEAARLAARRMSASEVALEGRNGFFALFSHGRACPEQLVRSLGRPWDLVASGVSVKKYPCCFAMHRAADGVLDLRNEHAVRASDVRRVLVEVPPGSLAPLIHDRARTGLEGKFCMRYTMAAALLDGRLGLDTYRDEMVLRPSVQELGGLVEVHEDPSITVQHSPFDEGHVDVSVELADGRRLERRVEQPLGAPGRPLGWPGLEAKFRDCAATVLDPAAAERALSSLRSLESVASVAELVRELTPGGAAAS